MQIEINLQSISFWFLEFTSSLNDWYFYILFGFYDFLYNGILLGKLFISLFKLIFILKSYFINQILFY